MSFPPAVVIAIRLILILAALYAVVVFLAWSFQERIAFPGPNRALPVPAQAGIPDGEAVTLVASDGVELRGWYLPPNPPPDSGGTAPGLIWFYGNMETVADLAPILRYFRPPGIGMLVIDYRGYGESGGKPTEPGLYLDAEAAWSFIAARRETDSTRIAVYGRSLGSAVALYLATHRPVRAVVLDSPFSSSRDMTEKHYPFLPAGLLRLRLDNVARAGRLKAPLLVFHGTDDRIAPFSMGRAVARAGRAEELVAIEGSGHNDTYDIGGQFYRDRMHEFLAEKLR